MWRVVVSLLLAWSFQTALSQLECEQVDRCSCEMTDGSGRINLHALAHPNNLYRIDHSIFTFLYSPCGAMKNVNVTGECNDATSVCQLFKEGGPGYNYGGADSARFSVDPDTKQVRISYKHNANNITRVSNVNLVCDPGQREKALFELEWAEPLLLNFKLTSVCACPGGCMAPAVTCNMKDSCTCDMSDGTGAINLHPLDNPWAPLRSSHLQPDLGRNFTYYYNPCSGFSFTNTMCTNVSTCQVDTEAQLFYALGDVAPQPNPDVNQENGSVTFHYVNTEDTGRHSDIRLICDPDQHVPEFTSLGEPSENFYVMALKTRCACPGLCKDDPIARKARYLEWKASNSR
ncbi:uncharacterized protein LOC118414393 isoform X1 [Branchiostoma floridae]|uniref:Uncharacterized protein LOC118414393 isoform X1 n=1 Tax=Branchiostoma floridae TaxID=7739 RepID=A0A9J7MPF6_BRAFL|nr:uncharacterized protein LOC118414393 isoform X1 [Branchiostoma floridae]